METDNGCVTVTEAVAYLSVLAWLVALTIQVAGEVGAVYKPLEEIVPQVADQTTELSDAPVTVAKN